MLRLISVVLSIMLTITSFTVIPYPRSGVPAPVFTSSNSKDAWMLTDSNVDTVYKSEAGQQYIRFFVPQDSEAVALYIQWRNEPGNWELEISENGEDYSTVETCGLNGFINEYVLLPAKGVYIGIKTTDQVLISDLYLTSSAGDVDVQAWEPSCKKADLMVVTAHPDDELIFFGSCMPLYSGEQQKDTVVVYMTSKHIWRKRESLKGLWTEGVRQYPVYLGLPDERVSTMEKALQLWDRDYVTRLLVRNIRRFKPNVIVTHATNGEYGHRQHILTNMFLTAAVELASSASYDPESLKLYGLWTVPKFYVHLYGRDITTVNCHTPLQSFGGKTGLQIAQKAFKCHKSQRESWFNVLTSLRYDMQRFGLFYTNVGKDTRHDSMFENITPEKLAAISGDKNGIVPEWMHITTR